MECSTTGVRIAPMGARWTWNTLADNACSHHIPSLAPAVALPAPRHDRRRTGAAGSPPGGFPFVELTSRGCEICGRPCVPDAAQHKRTEVVRCRPGTVRGPWGGPGAAPHRSTPLRFALRRIRDTEPPLRAALFRGNERKRLRPGSFAPPRWTVGTRFATGRSPCGGRPLRRFGRIAQLVEQLTLNQRVPGSSPGAPTIDLASLFSVIR